MERMQSATRLLIPFVTTLLATAVATAQEHALPKAWHGVWRGTMDNTVKSGKTMKVPVVFEILPVADSTDLVWRKTYGGEGDRKVVKDYRLVRNPKRPDRFAVDEQNGIKLDLRKVGDVLHGCFRIGDQIYTSRYELRDGTVRFEITVAEPNGKKQEHGVQDYTTTVVQAAKLTREKPAKAKTPDESKRSRNRD